MKYHRSLIWLGMLGTSAAWAHVVPGQTMADAATSNAASTSPVAYVYVSNYIGTTGVTEVHAFSAAANGALNTVPGSPFADEITYMAVNGKYLMGATDNNIDINAYLIQPDGALSFWAQTNIVKQNQGCGSSGPFFFDHTGSSLYNFDHSAAQCANNTYEAFNVVKSDGQLTFLGDDGESENLNGILTVTGNNVYAYGAACYDLIPSIHGFKRNSDGSLTQLSINPAYPTPPPSADSWCPAQAAADPTNHVVIPMAPFEGFGNQVGPYQLAVYTADTAGNLTTTSTYANMPTVTVGYVNYPQMAPSGKVLAVAGFVGLQIFHVNGANPVTDYAVLQSTDHIDEMFWDNDNHLYAVSSTAGKLYVYTITPTGYSQAPGSPHAIGGAIHLIVQPWPRY